MKRLTPEAYRMHEFLLEYCVGEDNAMHALELGAWIGLSSKSAQRQVRKLREEINSKVSEIQRKVLTSDKGYYVACAEEAMNQYEEVAWRKIRSGVAQIIEGRNLLEHAKMDGQMRLKLTEYMKEFIEIGA